MFEFLIGGIIILWNIKKKEFNNDDGFTENAMGKENHSVLWEGLEDTDFSSLTITRHRLICFFSHFISYNELTNVLEAEPVAGHRIKLIGCALSSVFLFPLFYSS